MSQAAGEYTIVVGVDGSDASEKALRWAIDEAKLRNGRIVAVHTWQPPVPPADLTPTLSTDYVELLGDVEQAAQKLVADVVAKVVGDDATVPVEPKLIEGPAGSTLVEVASDADLLVIGSRGHGFVGRLIGSVSEHCVNHALCPVLVYRDPRR